MGAYALDALSLEERRRVEAALAADPEWQSAVAPLLAVAAMLAESVVEPADRPPAGLWSKIAAATAPAASVRERSPLSAWRRWLVPAVAATAVAATTLLAVVTVRQHSRLLDFEQSPLAAAAASAREQAGSVVLPLAGEVPAEAILTADGTGYLLTPDAPALSSDQTYQLWVIVGDACDLGRRPRACARVSPASTCRGRYPASL